MIGSNPVLLSLPFETINSFDQLLASPPRMRVQDMSVVQLSHSTPKTQQQPVGNAPPQNFVSHMKQQRAAMQQQASQPPALEDESDEPQMDPVIAKVSMYVDAEAIPIQIASAVIKDALEVETDQAAGIATISSSSAGCVASFTSPTARDKAVLAMRLHGQLPYARAADVPSVFRNRPRIAAIDCHSWVRSGKCAWDESCPFRHPPPVARVPCRHWFRNRGECWYGEHCNFLHPGTAVWVEKGSGADAGADDSDQPQQPQQQQQQSQKGQKKQQKQANREAKNTENFNNNTNNNNSNNSNNNNNAKPQRIHSAPNPNTTKNNNHHHRTQSNGHNHSHNNHHTNNNNNNNSSNNNNNNNNSSSNGSGSPNQLNIESLDLMTDAVVVRMPANPWTQTRPQHQHQIQQQQQQLQQQLQQHQHQSHNPHIPTASGPINVNNTNTAIGDPGPWVSQSAPEIYHHHNHHQARGGDDSVGVGVGGSFSSVDDEIVIRRTPWPMMLGCPETPGSTESVDSIGVVGRKKKTCSNCGENTRTIALIPCGHVTLCDDCGSQNIADQMPFCPSCNCNVEGTLRIHF